jgi:hypothetical protein
MKKSAGCQRLFRPEARHVSRPFETSGFPSINDESGVEPISQDVQKDNRSHKQEGANIPPSFQLFTLSCQYVYFR